MLFVPDWQPDIVSGRKAWSTRSSVPLGVFPGEHSQSIEINVPVRCFAANPLVLQSNHQTMYQSWRALSDNAVWSSLWILLGAPGTVRNRGQICRMAQGLAAGVLLGSAALVGIQFFALARRGFRFRFTLSRRTEGLASVAKMMVPSIAGLGVAQLNLIVMTSFASRLGDSRISALHYAQHLVLLPHGVLAMSFSTVIFPLMACQYYAGQTREMKQTIIRAL